MDKSLNEEIAESNLRNSQSIETFQLHALTIIHLLYQITNKRIQDEKSNKQDR